MIAEVSGDIDDTSYEALSEAFTIGPYRTHEQDTEFGLNVLAEIACRALSPGINYLGTAIQTLLALKEVLWSYAEAEQAHDADVASRVFVRFADEDQLLRAAFAPIARDGAATIEVACMLQEVLGALGDSENERIARAAHDVAARALAHAEKAGLLKQELDELRRVSVAASDDV